jgi:hypothetical protein
MPNSKSPARQSAQRWFVSEEFHILADDTPRAYKQHPHFDVRLGITIFKQSTNVRAPVRAGQKILDARRRNRIFFGEEKSDFFGEEKKEEIIGRPKYQPGTRAEVRYNRVLINACT